MIIEIAKTESSIPLAEVSQESSPKSPPLSRASQHFSATSPRQLTRQSTILQSTSVEPAVKDRFLQSVALCEDFVKAIKDGQKEQADLIRGDFQQCFSALEASMARNHDLQQQMNEMQQLILQMQQQALDRLATPTWDPASILNNQFRLHFLCECGEHTKVLSSDNTNIPHHIHLAKHEGYDLHRPKEFFQKYGNNGVTIAGFAVPALAAVSTPGAIDMFKNSLDTISQSADALKGADLRHLEAFIKGKDEHRVLGNLYRTITLEGHVKWVCIDHYRLRYKEKNQQAFADVVEVNRGSYDPQLGQVAIRLQSKIRATEFFNALANARRVDDLDITFDWECSRSDIKAFENALKKPRVSILRLDLHRLRTSLGSKLISTSTRYDVLVHIMEHTNMKIIHIVLPKEFVKLSSLQPTQSSRLHKLSLKIVMIGRNELGILAETLKTNTTLTTLDLGNNSIKDSGAVVLSEALKTNLTLTILDLGINSIGNNGAVALSEALKTNSTLTTLNLEGNSVGVNGVLALSEAL
ncbi:hypothetical protein BGZ50_000303 [Haplosporangium sp. Z 11]|nr:hypothetical protein BGZ50_000303 [Haplosporangium sp. Z 11]